MQRATLFFNKIQLEDADKLIKKQAKTRLVTLLTVTTLILSGLTAAFFVRFPAQNTQPVAQDVSKQDNFEKKMFSIGEQIVKSTTPCKEPQKAEPMTISPQKIAAKPLESAPKTQPKSVPTKIAQSTKTSARTITKTPTTTKPKTTTQAAAKTTQKTAQGGDNLPVKTRDLGKIDENLPAAKLDPMPVNANFGIPEYWPLPVKVSDPYGYLPWRGRVHAGIDLTAPCDSLILAAGNGKVIRAEWYAGYGKCIDIQHASGYITRYAHLTDYLVKVGDFVEAGEWIGKVGSTGNSSCCHLHFEVHLNGRTIDPESIHWLNRTY
ncbi:MAG: M23 family metallopeptidase [Caldisericales bacterium]|nr:M23 family metallopeptidase [Caldisericales bacterium]